MGRLLLALQVLYLVHGVERRRQAAVHAQHRVVNDSGEAEAVEDLDAGLPNGGGAVFFEALVVEAVHLRDLPGLVVAANQRHALRIAHLECEQQQEGFDRVVAAVDKVSHEDIVDRGHLTADVEELKQVVELAVDVAHHRGRDGHKVHILLLQKDLPRLCAELLHLLFWDDFALLQRLNLLIHIQYHPSNLARPGARRAAGRRPFAPGYRGSEAVSRPL